MNITPTTDWEVWITSLKDSSWRCKPCSPEMEPYFLKIQEDLTIADAVYRGGFIQDGFRIANSVSRAITNFARRDAVFKTLRMMKEYKDQLPSRIVNDLYISLEESCRKAQMLIDQGRCEEAHKEHLEMTQAMNYILNGHNKPPKPQP